MVSTNTTAPITSTSRRSALAGRRIAASVLTGITLALSDAAARGRPGRAGHRPTLPRLAVRPAGPGMGQPAVRSHRSAGGGLHRRRAARRGLGGAGPDPRPQPGYRPAPLVHADAAGLAPGAVDIRAAEPGLAEPLRGATRLDARLAPL